MNTPSEMPLTFREHRDAYLASLSPAERKVYDEEYAQAKLRRATAELIYDAREAAGLTQAQLAERAGTSQAVISALENGARTPTLALLTRLAAGLGVTIDLAIGTTRVALTR